MTWTFRLRFHLTQGPTFNVDEERWPLWSDAQHAVTLRHAHKDGTALREATHLALVGVGYDSESDALREGERWRDAFTVALVRSHRGADFGDRSPGGTVFSTAVTESFREQTGRRLMGDRLGITAYETADPVQYASFSATGIVYLSADSFQTAVQEALRSNVRLSRELRLAYDIFTLAVTETNPEAKLLILAMTLEILIKQEPRSDEAQAFVRDSLAALEQRDELPSGEKDSLKGSLTRLLYESIGSAGRRLVSYLGDKRYEGATPQRFFTECYEIRSRLIHGEDPLPTHEQIRQQNGPLSEMVSDVLLTLTLDQPPDQAATT